MKLLIISLKLDKECTKDIKRGHVLLLLYIGVMSLCLVLRTLRKSRKSRKSRKCLNKSPRPKQSLLSIGYLVRGETLLPICIDSNFIFHNYSTIVLIAKFYDYANENS